MANNNNKQSFPRALKTSVKQIKRSGWLAWASISVMTLAFIVAQIFLFLGYTANLFLKFIENKPHIYLFFKPGTEESEILDIKSKWEKEDNIAFIDYTSEEEALEEFKEHNEKTNPLAVEAIRENVLPASLAIRLESIDDAQAIIDLANKEESTNPNITQVGYSQEIINNIKDAFFWIRLAGAIIMGLLFIVIFFFTLLTVEFRMFSRAEEIKIMQLVGGSLWYIRLPFILEGAIYGGIGAAISSALFLILGLFMFVVQAGSPTITFLTNFFGDLDWIAVNVLTISAFFLISIIGGILLGAFNSFFAIRNYIK